MNPISKQEYAKETTEVTSTEGNRSKPATPSRGMPEPSTSKNHMLQRQQSIQVSSFRIPVDKDQDIKERYKEIKARNERLKAQTYA